MTESQAANALLTEHLHYTPLVSSCLRLSVPTHPTQCARPDRRTPSLLPLKKYLICILTRFRFFEIVVPNRRHNKLNQQPNLPSHILPRTRPAFTTTVKAWV